jgi:pyridoxamine 5'-phosphate oxidase
VPAGFALAQLEPERQIRAAMDIADLRREYTFGGLRRRDMDAEPIQQFNNWLQGAIAAGVPEPNAMTLATVDGEGQPSSRIVLLKGIAEKRGFKFFTNYQSRKGRELEDNPRAALTIFWPGLERQICIRGSCSKLPQTESELYFKSRPLGSRVGAWVSSQSTVIPDRAYLEKRLEELTAQFKEDPPLPPHWGGYLLEPISLDFWQGRPNRLHDRFLYTRRGDGWHLERLAP